MAEVVAESARRVVFRDRFGVSPIICLVVKLYNEAMRASLIQVRPRFDSILIGGCQAYTKMAILMPMRL